MSSSDRLNHSPDNLVSVVHNPDKIPGKSQISGITSGFQVGIHHAQEKIYRFLLTQVRSQSPDQVIYTFKHVFFEYHTCRGTQEIIKEVTTLLLSKQEEEFRYTLKRSCYILINNWISVRATFYIQKLIKSFDDISQREVSDFYLVKRLQKWLENFVKSQDYQELKLFTSQYLKPESNHWSERYTPYLLTAQYSNKNNPKEQREAAKKLAQKLHYQFKFALVKYTAHLQSPIQKDSLPTNPTILGEDILRFIKAIINKNGTFSCRHLARIFIKQTQGILYINFKDCLSKYLIFSVKNQALATIIEKKITEKLASLYQEHHQEPVDNGLRFRTCKQIINFFTTENQQEPSELFSLCLSQGHPLVLVSFLLKIVLIAPKTHTYLETQIADLIEYYRQYSQSECELAIKFFEIFRITFAVHTDNVQYNLIRVENTLSTSSCAEKLDGYRIFSQYRGEYVRKH